MTDGYTAAAGWRAAFMAQSYIPAQMDRALPPAVHQATPAPPRYVEEAITKAHV